MAVVITLWDYCFTWASLGFLYILWSKVYFDVNACSTTIACIIRVLWIFNSLFSSDLLLYHTVVIQVKLLCIFFFCKVGFINYSRSSGAHPTANVKCFVNVYCIPYTVLCGQSAIFNPRRIGPNRHILYWWAVKHNSINRCETLVLLWSSVRWNNFCRVGGDFLSWR